jgi:hypothetical protein
MSSGKTSTGWTGAAFCLPGKSANSRATFAKAGDVNAIRLKGVLQCVTDGSPSGGCHDMVAEVVSQSLFKSYYGPEAGSDTIEALRYAVQNSVQTLDDLKDPRCTDLSVSVAAVVVQDNQAFIAYVGDALVYAVNAERIALLTASAPDFSAISEASLTLAAGDRIVARHFQCQQQRCACS